MRIGKSIHYSNPLKPSEELTGVMSLILKETELKQMIFTNILYIIYTDIYTYIRIYLISYIYV